MTAEPEVTVVGSRPTSRPLKEKVIQKPPKFPKLEQKEPKEERPTKPLPIEVRSGVYLISWLDILTLSLSVDVWLFNCATQFWFVSTH